MSFWQRLVAVVLQVVGARVVDPGKKPEPKDPVSKDELYGKKPE